MSGPSPRRPRTDAKDAGREARPRLRKELGQHHLRSGASCRPLLEYLAPSGRLVVEIGPGGGVLTRELLESGARVLALELDAEWARTLRERLPAPELEIRVGDALDFDWSALPSGTLVAGNLPYNVGTAIVERVLKADPPVEKAAFLLQREVVERMVAEAGDDAYGALSALIRLRADARKLAVVKPGAFVPPPKVDSAFVGLKPRPLPAGLEGGRADLFESWIRQAFGQRRKTLANALSRGYPREQVLSALSSVRRPATIRAEALALPELLQVFALLEPGAPARGATSSRKD